MECTVDVDADIDFCRKVKALSSEAAQGITERTRIRWEAFWWRLIVDR